MKTLPLVALVCLVAALPIGVGLGQAPFDDPGEGMHAEIAREMLASGDPLPLRLNGVRYVDKPPLLYWLIAASFRMWGPVELAARVVPALAALAAVAATAWLGVKLLGRVEGLTASAALLTCVWFFVYARYVRPETLFVAALAWGFALTLIGLRDERRGLVVAGVAAFGIAGLAKDFLGVVGPIAAIGLAMALHRQLRPISRWLPPLGALAAAVLGFGWYAAAEAYARGFAWYTVVDNHLLNVLRARHFPDEDVPLTALEFIAVGLGGAMPWAIASGIAVADLVRRRAWRLDGELPWIALALWVVGVFATTVASGFRLPYYGLPAYPALALLAARAWRDHDGRAFAAAHAVLFGALALVGWLALAAGGDAFVSWVSRLTDVYTRNKAVAGEPDAFLSWRELAPLVQVMAVVCSIGALALVAIAVRGTRRLGLVVTALVMFAMLPPVAAATAFSATDRAVRGMALEVRSLMRPGDRLLHEGPIENSGALEFYSGRRPIIVGGTRSVLGFGSTFRDARDAFWDEERVQREWGGPVRHYLVSTRTSEHSITGRLPSDRVHLLSAGGGRRLYVDTATAGTAAALPRQER